jgi:DNA repair protein RecO (recombination protein O)
MTRVELQPSFVLHQRPYRETSLIVEAFGRDTGRVGILAKGARRPKSAERGMLQPFRPLLLTWSGRGELGLLMGAEPDGYASTLGGASLFSALYMNELLMRLMHRHDPHPELFESYGLALAALADGQTIEAVLRIFEKRLLEAVGYGLILDREIDTGEPVDGDGDYTYQADRGPVRGGSRHAAGVRVSGTTLLCLEREHLDDRKALDEAKRLMRTVLGQYLGDKPLASRSLFRTERH